MNTFPLLYWSLGGGVALLALIGLLAYLVYNDQHTPKKIG